MTLLLNSRTIAPNFREDLVAALRERYPESLIVWEASPTAHLLLAVAPLPPAIAANGSDPSAHGTAFAGPRQVIEEMLRNLESGAPIPAPIS